MQLRTTFVIKFFILHQITARDISDEFCKRTQVTAVTRVQSSDRNESVKIDATAKCEADIQAKIQPCEAFDLKSVRKYIIKVPG